MILKGKKLGFSLSEIFLLVEEAGRKDALESPSTILTVLKAKKISERMVHLEKKRRQIDEAIAELRAVAERIKPVDGVIAA